MSFATSRHFWWVNQNQTFEQEVQGGYLWSPKRNSNDSRNAFYEFMREVAPGDVVFSFKDTFVAAMGIAISYCYECPKPEEFGAAGRNWSPAGWKVDVRFTRLSQPLRPADHMMTLGPLLPGKYAPLSSDGRGFQRYLTRLGPSFAQALVMLLGAEADMLMREDRFAEVSVEHSYAPAPGQVEWEEGLVSEIQSKEIPQTEKSALILARRGQGLFKQRVQAHERFCRITRVDRLVHLRASHSKPWRDSSDEERLDGENGLLLTPSIDHLFDRGFLSFEGSGELLLSPVAHRPSLEKMGVPTRGRTNVGKFSEGQQKFLEYHRERVFLAAQVAS